MIIIRNAARLTPPLICASAHPADTHLLTHNSEQLPITRAQACSPETSDPPLTQLHRWSSCQRMPGQSPFVVGLRCSIPSRCNKAIRPDRPSCSIPHSRAIDARSHGSSAAAHQRSTPSASPAAPPSAGRPLQRPLGRFAPVQPGPVRNIPSTTRTRIAIPINSTMRGATTRAFCRRRLHDQTFVG